MNPKVVKSLLMCVISLLFTSFCITFAWFTGIRIQNAEGSNIGAVNIDGNLYFYEGNRHVTQVTNPDGTKTNRTQFSGFNSKDTLTNLGATTLISPDNSHTGMFTKQIDNNEDFDAFNMSELYPGTRHLFLLEVKSNFQDPNLTVSFNIDDWFSSMTPEEVIDPSGSTSQVYAPNPKKKVGNADAFIYLTEAIYIYPYVSESGTVPIIKSQDDQANMTAILNWINPLQNENAATFNKNKFVADGQKNPNVDAKNEPIPVSLETYTINNTDTYLIPFMIEFSNDPKTFYTYDSENSNVSVTYFKKGTAADPGSSDVYANMTFTIKKLSLTQYLNNDANQGGN